MGALEIIRLANQIAAASAWVKSLKEDQYTGDLDEVLERLGDEANLLACRCGGITSGFFGNDIDEIDRRLV